jgi:hypothetical protein
MSSDPFNSLGGFSAGIPPVTIVNAAGNIVTNVNTAGNVLANVVYATYYKWSNGVPFTGTPGGTASQIQFNNNGTFGGAAGVSWDGGNLALGAVSNVRLTGGRAGEFLQTAGNGVLAWNTPPVAWSTVPQSNTATGTAGQIAYDAGGNLYICVDANVWSKIAGTTSW